MTIPGSYEEAVSTLKGRPRKKVANNTYLETRGEDVAVRLHDTDVATFHPDNTVTLDTGGWLTVTTKDRMNSVLAQRQVRIGSNRGQWRLTGYSGPSSYYAADRFDVPYHDGMIVDADGSADPADIVAEAADLVAQAERREVDKTITAYLRPLPKLMETWQAEIRETGTLASAEGDPWCCLMRAEDGRHPLAGDPVEHWQGHIAEKYLFPSMLVVAAESRGETARVGRWLQLGLKDHLLRMMREYLRGVLYPSGFATRSGRHPVTSSS